jgi:hypothetical protein
MSNNDEVRDLEALIARKEEELGQLLAREIEIRPDSAAHRFNAASEGLRLRGRIQALTDDLHKDRQRLAASRR